MAKRTMIGRILSKDGMADAMEKVLADMTEAARQEPGVEAYSYHRGDDGTFWFFAVMSDEEAMAAHGRTPAMQAAMEAFGPLAAGPPEVWPATPIAAIGLGL